MLASSPVRGPAACTFGFGAIIGFLLGRVAIRRMAATSGGACVSGACVSGAVRHRIARSPRLSIVLAAATIGQEQHLRCHGWSALGCARASSPHTCAWGIETELHGLLSHGSC